MFIICKIIFIFIVLLQVGCFLDSKLYSLNNGSLSGEDLQKVVTYSITPLYHTNSISKFLVFDVEFSEIPESLEANDLKVSGGVLKSIIGDGKRFRIEVEASDYSALTVTFALDIKFMNSTKKLAVNQNPFAASPVITIKNQLVSDSFLNSVRSAETPDGSVYVLGQYSSWGTDLSKFGNVGVFNQSGALQEVKNVTPSNKSLFTFSNGSYLAMDYSTCHVRLYLQNGTVDSGFTSVRFAQDAITDSPNWCGLVTISSVVEQASGKLVIAGEFGLVNGVSKKTIVRINTNGTVDNSFVSYTDFSSDEVYKLIQESDGSMFLTGRFFSFNGNFFVSNFVKIDMDGNIDSTYLSNRCCTATQYRNGVLNTENLDILKRPDGKYYLIGTEDFRDGSLSAGIDLYDSNGIRDLTFTANLGSGFTITNSGSTYSVRTFNAYVQSDGKLLVLATAQGTDFRLNGVGVKKLFRLNLDGTVDNTFGFDPIYAGKILINGQNQIEISHPVKSYEGNLPTPLVKISPSGQITNPMAEFEAISGVLNDIHIDNAGKTYLAGSFAKYGSTNVTNFVRLNADRTRDTSYDSTTGFNGTLIQIVPLDGDRMLYVGYFSAFKGAAANGISILDNSANLVSGISYVGFSGGLVSGVKKLSDGNLIVWGSFTSYRGSAVSKVILLNQNLDLIMSYSLPGIPPHTFDICELDGDTLLAVGSVQNFIPTLGAKFLRFKKNGSLDAGDVAFNSNVSTAGGTYDYIFRCSKNKDGSILVGGRISALQGKDREGIIHIKNDGTVIDTFLADNANPNGRIKIGAPETIFLTNILNFKNFTLILGANFVTLDGNKKANMFVLNPL